MAITYKISVGPAHLKIKAKAQRDLALKPKLTGLKKCEFCGGDTVIFFKQHTGYSGSGSVDWDIEPCCSDFKQLVYDTLGVNR